MISAGEIIANARSWRKIGERQARETLRTVYVVDDIYVVKQFELPASIRRYRRPWIIEDRGLRRLNGSVAPRSFGYTEHIENGVRRASLVKEFIPGTACTSFAPDDIPAVARLMAELHGLKIITDDANVHNFLKTADGRMVFIDLGRARVFRFRSPWLFLNIGWELAKLRREGFGWNRERWGTFLPVYFHQFACSLPGRWMIRSVAGLSAGQRMIRKTIQGKSPWS